MGLQRRTTIAPLLVVCSALAFSTFSEAKERTCTAVADGVAHSLVVSFTNSHVESFRYLSMTTDAAGFTCEIPGSKVKSTSWGYVSDGRTLSVELALDIDNGVTTAVGATVLESARTTTFRFLKTNDFKVHHAECGLNGYVAPVITLVEGSKKCRLGSSEEQF